MEATKPNSTTNEAKHRSMAQTFRKGAGFETGGAAGIYLGAFVAGACANVEVATFSNRARLMRDRNTAA